MAEFHTELYLQELGNKKNHTSEWVSNSKPSIFHSNIYLYTDIIKNINLAAAATESRMRVHRGESAAAGDASAVSAAPSSRMSARSEEHPDSTEEFNKYIRVMKFLLYQIQFKEIHFNPFLSLSCIPQLTG